MLYHVDQELEVVHVAEVVEAVVEGREGDKDVDQVCQGGMWQVVGVHL